MIYIPRHFPIEELVPPEIIDSVPAHKAYRLWMLFDPIGLLTLDSLRDRYGSMIVNNHSYGGSNKYCGYRPPECTVGSFFSQHRFGRGFDPHPKEVTSEEIRDDIKSMSVKDREKFRLDGIRRMETDISWLHFDTGNWGLAHDKILFFKP